MKGFGLAFFTMLFSSLSVKALEVETKIKSNNQDTFFVDGTSEFGMWCEKIAQGLITMLCTNPSKLADYISCAVAANTAGMIYEATHREDYAALVCTTCGRTRTCDEFLGAMEAETLKKIGLGIDDCTSILALFDEFTALLNAGNSSAITAFMEKMYKEDPSLDSPCVICENSKWVNSYEDEILES